ncbi:MAG: ABC transporter permease [Thermoguttaceae bacterium]|jgi:lipopolysaccharide transport system permease protein|nr:ABC transporter permease [Thermoguttaceae bacterium]
MRSQAEPTIHPADRPTSIGASRSAARTVIDAAQPWRFVDFGELWRSRDLLWMLTARDLKVRYRQAVVGAAWAVLQPVLTMVIFGVLFGLLGRKPAAGDAPYLVTAYCGLLPWHLLATSLSQATASLVNDRHVITRVYFPRMLLPMASVVAALVDFGIAAVVLAGLMAWFGIAPTLALVTLPGFVLLAVLVALGAGLWLSALNALYRDIGYTVPFLLQVGFFVSPVVYETAALVPERWRLVYSLNPMVGAIEGFRWALLGGPAPPMAMLGVSMAVAAAFLLGGMAFFRRVEHVIADRI